MAGITHRRRHVEIFNFSFLDILACVIGLLIYILTIVVISSGGAAVPSRTGEAKMEAAEAQIRQARLEAEIARNRRIRAEAVLKAVSVDVTDVTLGRDAVEAQVRSYGEEARDFHNAAASLEARFVIVTKRSAQLKVDWANVERLRAIDAEIAEINARSKTLKDQIAELQTKQKNHPKQDITYYVPHVRSTDRLAVWVEIDGDRVWSIDSSGDYDRDTVRRGSWLFTRKAAARGTLVADVLAGKALPPWSSIAAVPNDSVLTCIVRPSGYAAYRNLREWAWKKGYAVHWYALAETETINLIESGSAKRQ